jgi:methionyl-tRNA formyltransferase
MRIVFAGGKDVGCGCLEYLLEYPDVDVVAVIVNSDGDMAAKRWYRSAAELALRHDVPVFAPHSINEPKMITRLQGMAPDLIVVVYYDCILKGDVIGIPKRGCINLHLALAEEYRGCYPTTWALINGEIRTGVTLHYIDEGIDTGDIIAQKAVEILPDDTGKSLYYKCTRAGIELFREAVPSVLEGTIPRVRQITTERSRYYKREFPSQCIEFTKSGEEVYNHIRAVYFPPFPLPYFYIGRKKMVIAEEKYLRQPE